MKSSDYTLAISASRFLITIHPHMESATLENGGPIVHNAPSCSLSWRHVHISRNNHKSITTKQPLHFTSSKFHQQAIFTFTISISNMSPTSSVESFSNASSIADFIRFKRSKDDSKPTRGSRETRERRKYSTVSESAVSAGPLFSVQP
jgi:hypothetical protein